MQRLDLSNNFLGLGEDGSLLPREAWCQNETTADLVAGAGWCPESTPLVGTTGSLTHLNLANNQLAGALFCRVCVCVCGP